MLLIFLQIGLQLRLVSPAAVTQQRWMNYQNEKYYVQPDFVILEAFGVCFCMCHTSVTQMW